MSNDVDQALAQVETWIQKTPFDLSQTSAHFVTLEQILSRAQIPDQDQWANVAQAMQHFLDAIESIVRRGQTAKSESAQLFSILLTVMAEAGQYRHEQARPASKSQEEQRVKMMETMGELRKTAIRVAKTYLAQPAFDPLRNDFEAEIYPLLDSMNPDLDPDRFMPFRVIQIGNIAERLYGFTVRTDDPYLVGDGKQAGLLREIYDRKYLRFGTSGVRGRWERDFTQARAQQVVQAVCDFLKNQDVPAYVGAEDLSGKCIIIGYDSRLNARKVAEWTAAVCLANGFSVKLANRDTPTPALVFYMTDYLNPGSGSEAGEVAGLINCTASHNPPEWQGIKFNPRLGYPAPTNVTDFIAARVNEIQMLDRPVPTADLDEANSAGRLQGFDPIDLYTRWILNSGNGNQRIPLDTDRIRDFFSQKTVVIDEMHGSARGYLTRLLGEIGVRYTVIHAETDPTLPGLDYANPEEPFIGALKDRVKESGAVLGLGMDTDADRFGIVDRGGIYLRPNQILPILIHYLGVDRGLTGRVIATQTGSPLIEPLADQIAGNERNRPDENVIPAYIDHPFYHRRVGKREDRVFKNTFMVPVGIKYIEEQRRTDRAYHGIKDKDLPATWRDTILIGGEESSGLTTRGHVTDKDGVWANLLVMDMLAYYGSRADNKLNSISEIWQDLCNMDCCWASYGGQETQVESSNRGRTDVDAVLEAKEDLINYYLDSSAEGQADNSLAGLAVIYAGGVRYDIAEMQLRDAQGDERHFVRVRSSGTEPINRIYVESSDPETAHLLMQTVLDKLDELIAREIKQAATEWRLVDILTTTKLSSQLIDAVKATADEHKWSLESIVRKLEKVTEAPRYLEGRNKRMANRWINALSQNG
ncbi:MAG: hypothetical protein JW850_14625 [Thermoflexales bacterium]|nr:hypothetical protein [Thermoflexales bacterium]